MFDEKSRYLSLETREHEEVDGRTITFVSRRFIPPPEAYLVAGGVRVTDSDRIDIITHRGLGLATGFWQIADANGAMEPEDLTETVGRRIVLPVPRATGAKE